MNNQLLANEAARLSSLRDYHVLDSSPEESLDLITRCLADYLDVSIALISLVDEDRVWFKSRSGLDAEESPREFTFCDHAIRSDGLLFVPDALEDPRFADAPLVRGPPGFRFYAGMPLLSRDGFALGTLCAIGTVPRHLTGTEREIFEDFAGRVMEIIEARRGAQEATPAPQGTAPSTQPQIGPTAAAPSMPSGDAAPTADSGGGVVAAIPRGHGARVLLIEDDHDLRVLLVSMLQSLAYRVTDVREAAAARRSMKEGAPFDLVLSDVMLPGGTSGLVFARELRETHPGLPVVFMSGYPAGAFDAGEFHSPRGILLNKPFSRRRLAEALQTALGR